MKLKSQVCRDGAWCHLHLHAHNISLGKYIPTFQVQGTFQQARHLNVVGMFELQPRPVTQQPSSRLT
jgi:hypothetical protein